MVWRKDCVVGRVLPREPPHGQPCCLRAPGLCQTPFICTYVVEPRVGSFVSELEASKERKIWKITEEEVRSVFCVVGRVVLSSLKHSVHLSLFLCC